MEFETTKVAIETKETVLRNETNELRDEVADEFYDIKNRLSDLERQMNDLSVVNRDKLLSKATCKHPKCNKNCPKGTRHCSICGSISHDKRYCGKSN